MRTKCCDFIHNILDTNDVVFAEHFLDDSVVGEPNTRAVDVDHRTVEDDVAHILHCWRAVEGVVSKRTHTEQHERKYTLVSPQVTTEQKHR